MRPQRDTCLFRHPQLSSPRFPSPPFWLFNFRHSTNRLITHSSGPKSLLPLSALTLILAPCASNADAWRKEWETSWHSIFQTSKHNDPHAHNLFPNISPCRSWFAATAAVSTAFWWYVPSECYMLERTTSCLPETYSCHLLRITHISTPYEEPRCLLIPEPTRATQRVQSP